jgi:outer membrane protein OmpA-like peptidoglycan-associated protein
MNRFLLPLLILLWSLLYTGWWNCNRKPLCSGEPIVAEAAAAVVAPPPPIDTVKVVTAEEQILFTPLDIYFDVNQAGIKKTAAVDSFLSTAQKYLAKYPEKQLLVTGHTDSDGGDDFNQKLSERRAAQTKTFLVKEGIKAGQMTTEGDGEKNPIASNDTDEGKAQNRRSTVRLKE